MFPMTATSAMKTPALGPFFLLCLIGFATLFSSYLRLPVLPLLAAEIGAGPAAVGMISGAFMLSAGLLSIPAGLLADRFGRRLPILAGIVANAAAALLIVQCRYPQEMAAVGILFGIGLACFSPAMLSLVADITPAERLGRAYGWYTTAVYFAMTLGPATGGFVAEHYGLRPVFFLSGGLLFLVAFLAAILLPPGPPRHPVEIRGLLAAAVPLLGERGFLACLLATVASCIGFGIFLTFVPLYAAGLGHDPAAIGIVFAAQALVNVVGRIPIGRLADRLDRRRLVGSGLLFHALALPALGRAATVPALVGCAILLGVGMALTYTAIGALIAELVPARQRGLAMGLYNSCIYLGMMAGATLMGLALKGIGYPTGFALAGGVALFGLAGFRYMQRQRHVTGA